MNLKTIENSRLYLFGRTRALNLEELDTLLKNYNCERVDVLDESVQFVLEGRMISPVDEDRLYAVSKDERKTILFLEAFERALCENLDDNRLLMSLKLSKNQERLMVFLENQYISDSLFLKLFKLYDWRDEGLYDSDENRDMSSAFVYRFYSNKEHANNVKYTNAGFMELLRESEDSAFIDYIGALTPIKNIIKNSADNSTLKIVERIIRHPNVSDKLINYIEKNAHEVFHELLAQRREYVG